MATYKTIIGKTIFPNKDTFAQVCMRLCILLVT